MHGIARYVYQLLREFCREGGDHRFYVIINPNSPLEELDWPSHVELVHATADWISFREQWELPRLLRRLGADLLHAPSFVAPLRCPCKLLMTIHDLNHLVLPQYYTPLHQFYYQIFVRSCIRRSEFILTVSEFSKREIVRNLHLSPEKVFVTYNGLSEHYQPVTDPQMLAYVQDIYELPSRFILCLSNNKPHKNLHQLVRAFCHSQLQMPLVLATPVDRSIIRIAENYGKKYLIYFAKFIEEEHLPVVYSMTHLFVYPSTYEGFGLPPLEALACGVPVVVAKAASLPEIMGDSAIFTDPFDFQDMADALVLGSTNEEMRKLLVQRGIAHGRKFSWRTMTHQTLRIYERCMVGTRVHVQMSQTAAAPPSPAPATSLTQGS